MRALELQAPRGPSRVKTGLRGGPPPQMLLRGLLSAFQSTCFRHGLFFSLSAFSSCLLTCFIVIAKVTGNI